VLLSIIAIDVMGGDFGPSVTVPATLDAVQKAVKQPEHEALAVILVGKEDLIKPYLKDVSPALMARIRVHHASEKIESDDSPSKIIRVKKDASMRVAINLVHEGEADACLSAGNTGALMALSRLILKTLPGIDRPAIATEIPTINDRGVRMLDLGANVDCSADHLVQFAVMASVLVEHVKGIKRPKVALLNIGDEMIKGNEQVKATHQLLEQLDALNYVGYIEANAIFTGEVDVVVCDGFIGNVALKSCEGTAALLRAYLREAFTHNWLAKVMALIASPVLRHMKKHADPRRHNGASLLGLNGVVVKSHGGADRVAFEAALMQTMILAEKQIPDRIRHCVGLALNHDKELS
jgi:phosphate acyltransferase